jgi:hypothetical protein
LNIRLVPYTWARDIHVALVCTSSCLLAWWGLLAFCAWQSPFWSPTADLNVLLGVIGMGAALGALIVEGTLEAQSKSWWRKGALITGPGALLVTHLGAGLGAVLTRKFVPGAAADFTAAPLLSVLKYSILSFVFSGLFFGLWMAWWRKASYPFYATVGLCCGLAAALVWHLMAGTLDLYHASAFAAVTWGATFGLLAWGVPRRLYAGWLRVLSGSRFGWRVRVDGETDGSSEIVVGHYSRGLNLWLPSEEGVRELHLSVAVDNAKHYTARGMSLYPTVIKRSMEKVDLRYDPARPAPLETPLKSGDQVIVGDGQAQTVLEFVMLPRKEDS